MINNFKLPCNTCTKM